MVQLQVLTNPLPHVESLHEVMCFGLEEILMKYIDKRGLELRSSSLPDRDSQLGLSLKLASNDEGLKIKLVL